MQYPESIKMKNIMKSEIRNMSIECQRVNGINLSQGICDLPLPEILSISANEAMKNGMNHYTRYDGIDILREQIAKKKRFPSIKLMPIKIRILSCRAERPVQCILHVLRCLMRAMR